MPRFLNPAELTSQSAEGYNIGIKGNPEEVDRDRRNRYYKKRTNVRYRRKHGRKIDRIGSGE